MRVCNIDVICKVANFSYIFVSLEKEYKILLFPHLGKTWWGTFRDGIRGGSCTPGSRARLGLGEGER